MEVASFVEVSQFVGGRSAYECVAYSAALIKFAGKAGQRPNGTASDVFNTAQYWYARLEGSNDASNRNGMSLQAEYTMLAGLGLRYYPIALTGRTALDIDVIKARVLAGYAVMLCAAETSIYDLDLGDRVPYGWPPSGNHCIVISGIASDGNLLVRDTANIGPAGLRPDPRRYDANRLQIVSATAVQLPFALSTNQSYGDVTMLSLTDPMGQHFIEKEPVRWHCKDTGVDLTYAHLTFYRMYGGIFGLPLTNEIYLASLPNTAIVIYERAIAIYDPQHKADNPSGSGPVYLLHINEGIGQQIIAKPLITELQKQLDTIKAEATNKPDVSGLQAQLQSYQAAFNQLEALVSQMKGKVY